MLIEDLVEKVASGELTEGQAVDETFSWQDAKKAAGQVRSRIGTAWKAKKPAFQEYVTKKISQLKTSAQNAGKYFAGKLGAKT